MATIGVEPGGGGGYVPTPSIGVDLSQPSLGSGTDTSTGSDDSSGGTGDAEIRTFDVSGLPFKFNPPMHKSLRFVRTNLGEGAKKSGVMSFYDETQTKYDADFAVRKDAKKTGFEDLRLGRIIMDDMAVSKGIIESGSRYGFRFLYNPAQLGGQLNISTNFIPDQGDTHAAVLQKGIENLNLEVLINRIPDVQGKAAKSEYIPQISEGARKRIQEQGTQYDIDFLYRCANGLHDTRQRTQTGDIGVLLPNPCRLIIGPYTSRGAVVSVTVNDQMFSRDMVPILSYVSIQFARFLNMTPVELERAQSSGMTQDTGSSDSGGGDAGSGDPTFDETPGGTGGSSATKLSSKDVWKLARDVGFSPAKADVMTQISKKESGWNSRAHNPNARTKDNSYGLWQINMFGNMGDARRKEYGIHANDELFNPIINAKAARKIYNGQGFSAWSVYNSGSYRSVPIDWR